MCVTNKTLEDIFNTLDIDNIQKHLKKNILHINKTLKIMVTIHNI